MKPEAYDAWYQSPHGQWIGDSEVTLLKELLKPKAGASLLDVGSGTGYFSRRFRQLGLSVTGIDPDPKAIEFAKNQDGDITYLPGDALALPFTDNSFDYAIAVTSLCFVDDPARAIMEMWRVAHRSIVIGVLNRHSLLYLLKKEHGGYKGARWDRPAEIPQWQSQLRPKPTETRLCSAIFLPWGGHISQAVEALAPKLFLWGGFLALSLKK